METFEQQLERLYIDDKKGTWAIAKELGISQSTVIRRLREYGIKLRNHRQANAITQNTSFVEGAKHPNWAGDNVSYQALHTWVRSRLGTPKQCQECGTTALKRYEWANISGEYKREFSDWIRLCPSCHRKRDNRKRERSFNCALCKCEVTHSRKKKYRLCRNCMLKCYKRDTLKDYES